MNATGEVLFLSDSSLGKEEIVSILNFLFFFEIDFFSNLFSNSSAIYIEIIAGGASEAPKRKSLPGLDEDNLIKSLYSSTPFIKQETNIKNKVSFSHLGSNKFKPVSVNKE